MLRRLLCRLRGRHRYEGWTLIDIEGQTVETWCARCRHHYWRITALSTRWIFVEMWR